MIQSKYSIGYELPQWLTNAYLCTDPISINSIRDDNKLSAGSSTSTINNNSSDSRKGLLLKMNMSDVLCCRSPQVNWWFALFPIDRHNAWKLIFQTETGRESHSACPSALYRNLMQRSSHLRWAQNYLSINSTQFKRKWYSLCNYLATNTKCVDYPMIIMKLRAMSIVSSIGDGWWST